VIVERRQDVVKYSRRMPVEGQWERSRTPLGRRDKLLLGAVGLTAVAAAIVAAIVLGSRGGSAGPCVAVTLPSTMGGASIHRCGAAAHELCRSQGAADEVVARACRAQGFAADVP